MFARAESGKFLRFERNQELEESKKALVFGNRLRLAIHAYPYNSHYFLAKTRYKGIS